MDLLKKQPDVAAFLFPSPSETASYGFHVRELILQQNVVRA
jgi:hypothetical protein